MRASRSFPFAAGVLALGLSSPGLLADGMSAGGYHSVRVDAGQVKGLGDGTYGQLGTNPAGTPATISGLAGITHVAAGGFCTLALKSDGTVWFLGEFTLQQTTPHGTPNPVSTPVQVPGLSGIDRIASGHRHFLALDADTGDLYAWGHNGSGQVGNGGLLDITAPAIVLTGVSSISAGDGFSLAVKTDQTLWAWGRNSHGQLSLGDTADRSIPTQVPGITTAVEVAAGGQHALIRLANGSLLATGNNGFGQLGLGNTNSTSTPMAVPGLSGITRISAGYFHSAAIGSGNEILVWGRNFEGQCGGGGASPVNYHSPQALAGLSGTPTQVDCGYHFTLIGFADGTFAGTGSNSDGQLDGFSVADQGNSRKILSPQFTPLSSEAIPPGIDSLSPPNGSSGVSTATTLLMTFDEVVQKGSGNILIKENLANAVVATVAVGSGNVVINGAQVTVTLPGGTLANGTPYYLEVANGAIKDLSGNPFGGIAGLGTWSFTTAKTATSPAAIAITNHSFEADENTDATGAFASGSISTFGRELTGWISKSGAATQIAVGWKDITASALDPSPPVGGRESQALSLQTGASALNTTGTAWASLSPGDEITLTISLGLRAAAAGLNWNENTFFGLTDGAADLTTIELGDTVANSGTIANNPATGNQAGNGGLADVSLAYTVLASDLTRTGNLGILIFSQGTGAAGGSANQSFFDHVRLDRRPVSSTEFASYLSDPIFDLDPGVQGFADDPDGDDIPNGLEAWFGTHPGVSTSALPHLATVGNTTTFEHPQNETTLVDISGFYQWSPNLTDWYAGDGVAGPLGGPRVVISRIPHGPITTVTAVVSEPTERIFLRICVQRN